MNVYKTNESKLHIQPEISLSLVVPVLVQSTNIQYTLLLVAQHVFCDVRLSKNYSIQFCFSVFVVQTVRSNGIIDYNQF